MSDGDHSPGAAFLTKIYDQTLAAAAASIDTGAVLPQQFNDLWILLSVRGDVAATNGAVLVRFNADSGSNYYSQYNLLSGGGSLSGTQSDAASFGRLSDAPGATATASEFGVSQVLIPCYSFTDRHKAWISSGGEMYGTSSNTRGVIANGSWQNTAAITRIQILPSSGNIIAGSRMAIYAS